MYDKEPSYLPRHHFDNQSLAFSWLHYGPTKCCLFRHLMRFRVTTLWFSMFIHMSMCCLIIDKSVLKYISRGDGHVELISTEVPESHRGKGVAAHLAKVNKVHFHCCVTECQWWTSCFPSGCSGLCHWRRFESKNILLVHQKICGWKSTSRIPGLH